MVVDLARWQETFQILLQTFLNDRVLIVQTVFDSGFVRNALWKANSPHQNLMTFANLIGQTWRIIHRNVPVTAYFVTLIFKELFCCVGEGAI